jgi:hypothetical protein
MLGFPRKLAYVVILLYVAPRTSRSSPEHGLAYDFEGTSSLLSAGHHWTTSVIVEGHARLLGDKLRVDLTRKCRLQSSMGGYYLIALDHGHRLFWIHPEDQTFYEVHSEVGDAGLLLPPLRESGVPELSNIQISVKRVGDGEKLQGHRTVHYRFSQVMDVRQSTSPATIHNQFSVDYYFPDDLPDFTNPLLFRAVYSSPGKVPDEYLHLVRSELAKLPMLAPLRSIYRDRNIDTSRPTTTVEDTTFTVTHLQPSDISSAIFEIPSEFRKIDRPHNNCVTSDSH